MTSPDSSQTDATPGPQPASSAQLSVPLPLATLIKVVLAVALIVGAWSPWLDRQAEGYYEQAFSRALVTFGLARALNGVISVIQGTELSLQPGGVGVTLAPGELVDPVNDLIERFSWVMLASSTSLGSQKILMDISAWWGISLLLTLAALVWAVAAVRRQRATEAPGHSAPPHHYPAARLVLRLLLLALFLRFAMPVMVLLNEGVYALFMADEYNSASAQIEQTRNELEDLSAQESDSGPEPGLVASISNWFDETSDALNVRQKMALYKEKLAGASEQFLRLAAVFMLQTIILPLLFLWGIAKGLRNIGLLLGRGG